MNLYAELEFDLWDRISHIAKDNIPVVMYGMGNGADKILTVLASYGVEVADFMASDGFVRGHSFHGKTVLSYAQVKEKYPEFVIVISFGSSLPDVLAVFRKLDSENLVFVPDVPISGNELFTLGFCRANADKITAVYEMLADERSKRVYENVIKWRLSGQIKYLNGNVSDFDEVFALLHAADYTMAVDLGAYNGDSVRTLIRFAGENSPLERIIALEPDVRTFKKLAAYAEDLKIVQPVNAGAWCEDTVLDFSVEGNRNSSVYGAGRKVAVQMRSVDSILQGSRVDYIKFDVEGSEYEALMGCRESISAYKPDLAVSLYHRAGDIWSLALLIKTMCPQYKLYMRRPDYIPAWDLCLYATVK